MVACQARSGTCAVRPVAPRMLFKRGKEASMAFETILTKTEGAVGVITLNRPAALNALNNTLLGELVQALEAWDQDSSVRVVVITGSERAFAAGADIKEMAPQSYMDMYTSNFFASAADRIAAVRKPII